MKLSVITVTYNSAETLQDTIDSVAKQSYNDIEHIIVDGLSTDGTLDIIQSNPSIARYVSEKDEGLYYAMNKGVEMAEGDIIAILNSDDVYADVDVVKDMVQAFESQEVEAVYADLCYVDEKDLSKVVRYWRSGAYNRAKFRRGWMPPHPTLFLRKEVYQQYGLFNTTLRSAADYEIMLRFLYKQRINVGYLPRVTVLMRMGGNSNQSFKHRLKANKEDQRAWELNQLKMPVLLPLLKPLRKLPQFLLKPSV
jgi:glycosyltransferase involved in cell wall biosynthesis